MDKITLKNFRCFRDEQTVRLAPLSLLVGDNSTGKTSFLAMIRALWDVASLERPPDFKEEPYDLGSFDEIAHYRGRRGGRPSGFEIGFSINRKDNPFIFNTLFEKMGTVPVPTKRRIADREYWLESSLGDDKIWQVNFGTPKGQWSTIAPDESANLASEDHNFIPFHFLLRIIRRNRSKIKSLNGPNFPSPGDWKKLENICNRQHLYFRSKSPYASAPVRSTPYRTYDTARPLRDPEGNYTPMYLADTFFQDKTLWGNLKNALEDFGKAAGLFDEISVRILGRAASDPFQIQVRKFGDKLKGPQRNLIDVGYGVSQILPVITELLRDDAPPIFLLQQPEIHLHPSAQAALGSLFCQIADSERQLVVETHSDHLLDRIRMDIRDGASALKPEDVAILFFERQEIDVRIHSLTLDELGNVNGAPPGYRRFFMNETRRSLKL